MAQQILAPLLNSDSNGGKLMNVRRGMKKLWAESFAEESYRVVLLGKDGTHAHPGGISLNNEG